MDGSTLDPKHQKVNYDETVNIFMTLHPRKIEQNNLVITMLDCEHFV